MNSRIGYF